AADLPAAPEPTRETYDTTLWLGGHAESWWFNGGGSFQTQLKNYGMTLPLFQTGLTLTLEHMLNNWFGIGAELRWTPFSGEREDDAIHRSASEGYTIHRLSVVPMAFVQFGEDSYDSAWRGGFFAGLGGGPMLWSMRDDVDVGGEFDIQGGMFWRLFIDQFGMGVRITYRGALAEGLGPNNLAIPFDWSGSLDLQFGYRW
ncbi:MAG: hypothetical protein ACI9MR_003089, partial [Myxococcota bacterium]